MPFQKHGGGGGVYVGIAGSFRVARSIKKYESVYRSELNSYC